MLFLYGCSFSYDKTESYFCYYDKEQTKIKMKGEMTNGVENGIWEYYNLDGSLVQKGGIENGLLIGNWEYSFDSLNLKVNWEKSTINNFDFSLPNSFKFLKNDSKSFMYVDTINKEVFSIGIEYVKSDDEVQDYINESRINYFNNGYVIFDTLLKIKTAETVFYFYSMDFKKTELSNTASAFSIFIKIDSELVAFYYTANKQNAVKSKFFIYEIFSHSFYKGKRVFNALSEINEITSMNFN